MKRPEIVESASRYVAEIVKAAEVLDASTGHSAVVTVERAASALEALFKGGEMADSYAAYDGWCAGCGESLRVVIVSAENLRLLPPPSTLAIHQCAKPPVSTELVYSGDPRD